MRMPQTPDLRYFQTFSIWCVFDPSHQYKTIYMRFRFDPLSTGFSNQRVFNENAQRSMDERPKRIEMYAFSNENS